MDRAVLGSFVISRHLSRNRDIGARSHKDRHIHRIQSDRSDLVKPDEIPPI
jgi:hypothetical protein